MSAISDCLGGYFCLRFFFLPMVRVFSLNLGCFLMGGHLTIHVLALSEHLVKPRQSPRMSCNLVTLFSFISLQKKGSAVAPPEVLHSLLFPFKWCCFLLFLHLGGAAFFSSLVWCCFHPVAKSHPVHIAQTSYTKREAPSSNHIFEHTERKPTNIHSLDHAHNFRSFVFPPWTRRQVL